MAGEQLSNADFRKLLATPRPGGNTKQADTSKDAKPKKSKANKPFRPKPKSIDEAEEKEGDGNVYRYARSPHTEPLRYIARRRQKLTAVE